jgi:hypothetical protein
LDRLANSVTSPDANAYPVPDIDTYTKSLEISDANSSADPHGHAHHHPTTHSHAHRDDLASTNAHPHANDDVDACAHSDSVEDAHSYAVSHPYLVVERFAFAITDDRAVHQAAHASTHTAACDASPASTSLLHTDANSHSSTHTIQRDYA